MCLIHCSMVGGKMNLKKNIFTENIFIFAVKKRERKTCRIRNGKCVKKKYLPDLVLLT